MKLATHRAGGRDGTLAVVSRDGRRYLSGVEAGVPTLQSALDDWPAATARLQTLSSRVSAGEGAPLVVSELAAPLPRAYEWVDGSAYINHVLLVRKARGAEPPATLETDPLVYQGGSGVFLGPREDIVVPDTSWGLDLEGEVCVVLGDTARGTSREEAAACVRLLMLCNDVTYRNLIPAELQKGFGFFQSKPATAFSPFAVTPDELGGAFSDGRLSLTLQLRLNGQTLGVLQAGPEMHFSFFDLIAHITRTRAFTAGTILGSGTVSNADPAAGVSCLAERRMREILACGEAKTPFLQLGDEVAIDMLDGEETSVFGEIRQRVVAPPGTQALP